MAKELKTVVTVLAQAPGGEARPKLHPQLERQEGATTELVEIVHPRTKRRSQVFRFELEVMELLFDGSSNMEDMLLRMQRRGHGLTYDQLASFVCEMARLGCAEGTFGIEPSRRVIMLPWHAGPEPEIVVGQWPPDARQHLNRCLNLFREGSFRDAAEHAGPLCEHPLAGPAARRMLELVLIALETPLVARSSGSAAGTSSSPVTATGFDDEDAPADEANEWLEEATQVLSREELAATVAATDRRARALELSFSLRRGLRYALIATLVLAVSSLVPLPFVVAYPCEVLPARVDIVRAGLSAPLEEVLVREGELIEPGQLVARQRSTDQATRVERLEASVARAEAELALLRDGRRDEELRVLEARVRGLERAIGLAASRASSTRQEVRAGRAARTELEQVTAERAQLSAELRAARAQLELARAGERTEDVTKAELELRALEAELELQRALLGGAALRTREGGVVTTTEPEALVGRYFPSAAPVLEVADLSRVRLRIFVDEGDYEELGVGLPVMARLLAFPEAVIETTLQGTDTEVMVRGEERVLAAEALVDNAERRFAPGMTGYAEIRYGWRPLAFIAGRRALRWLRVALLV